MENRQIGSKRRGEAPQGRILTDDSRRETLDAKQHTPVLESERRLGVVR